jgi:hypothetical protein
MELSLTDGQVTELQVALATRIHALKNEIARQSNPAIQTAYRKNLERALPVYNALTAHIDAIALADDEQDDGDYHPYGDPQS